MESTTLEDVQDGRFAVLDSETLYQGRIFSVRVDEVAMPGGGRARREIVDHLRAVAVVAIDDDRRVVLIEQYRHPMRRRLWEVPAGLMDFDGESPLAAAQRELAEEVALAAENWSVLVDLATSPGFCTESIRVYLASGLRSVPDAPREDEEADLRVTRVPLDDAVAGVMDGRIVNATAVAGILAARHVLGGSGGDASGHGGPRHAVAAPLRSADDPWADGESVVAVGAQIGRAPELG